jgi:predicted ATPase
MIDTAYAPLVDRDEELGELVDALNRRRLVTVTGPGGVGKTRLAWAVATGDTIPPDQTVRWVELAAEDVGSVADAVADVVGDTHAATDAVEAVVEALATEPAVLVLDNCEQAVEPVGALVAVLLARCPGLRILATSRVPLGLPEELVLPLAPLLAPTEGADFEAIGTSPAVALFEVRARAASPRFRVTSTNAGAVAEICRHLDGLPLAIELAAARVQSVEPAEIAQRLDDRLQVSRLTPVHRSGRHRSLAKALSWSYELLSDDERTAFDRLSVFSGSFTAEAAASVTGIDDIDAARDLLAALGARSMLVVEIGAGDRRFRVLDTLSEFGQRNLLGGDDTKAAYDALRHHFLAFLEDAAIGLQGPDEASWGARVHADMPNIRTVFTRAVKTIDVDTALRIVVALFDFAFYRMRREVGAWADEAVALPGAPVHHLYGRAAAVAGYLAWQRGATDDAGSLTDLALAHSPSWVAYDSLGTIEMFRGRVDRAIPAYTRAAAIAATDHNDFLRSIATAQLGFAHVFAGTGDSAALTAEADTLARGIGNPTAIAFASFATGTVLFDTDPAQARETLERAVELAAGVDNRLTRGAAATALEELRTKLGRRTVAEDLDAALMQVENWLALDNAPNLWLSVRRIGRNFAAIDQFEAAALAFGAEAGADSKLPLRMREGDRHHTAVGRTQEALGVDDYAHHAARGASLSPDRLVAELRAAADAARGGAS